jgi:hypothetical protein
MGDFWSYRMFEPKSISLPPNPNEGKCPYDERPEFKVGQDMKEEFSYVEKLEIVAEAAKDWVDWRRRNNITSLSAHESCLQQVVDALYKEEVADGQLYLQIDDEAACNKSC